MKYIQSFYPYAIWFSSIDKGVPAANADGDMRNIAEVTEAELEKLQNSEPMFRRLISDKKYRVLNKLPDSYRPAATLVNEARERADAAEKELAELKAKLEAKETETKPETEGTKAKTSKKTNKKDE
jgi:hypothetical protein